MTKKHHFSEVFIEKVITENKKESEAEEHTHSFGWALRQLKKVEKLLLKLFSTGHQNLCSF